MGNSILFFVMTGVFLSTLDSGMMNVALPSIMRSLDISFAQTELIVSVYLVTITSSLLFWGTCADRIGKGRVYIAGSGLFACGALLCFFSASFLTLLVSRSLQAFGASMMMATGPAIIRETFATRYLGRSLGVVGIATACGLLAGPFVSGQILTHSSWKGIFLVSFTVAAALFFLGLSFMSRRLPPATHNFRSSFDWKGVLLWPVLIIMVISVIKNIHTMMSGWGLLLLVCCFGGGFLFFMIEKRSIEPLLPIPLFAERYFWTATLCALISFGVLFSVLVLVPFYLEYVLRVSFVQIGAVMMAVPATLIVFSPGAGYLFDRIGARLLCSFGLFTSLCALLLLSSLNESSSLSSVAIALAILGAGQSIFLSPNSASVLSRVKPEVAATTSAILATARNLGMAIGASMAATLLSLFYRYFSGGMVLSAEIGLQSDAFLQAFRVSFLLIGCMAVLGIVISLLRD